MLMLSVNGWMHGIVSITVFLTYIFFGFFFISKSKKSDAKLLFYLAIMLIVTAGFYLPVSSEFIVVLLTGKNSNFPYFLQFFIGWIWAPLSGGISLYIATELLIPRRKWYFRGIYLVLLILLFIYFLIDPKGNVENLYPINSGEELMESYVIIGSPASILIMLMASLSIGFCVVGTLVKGIHTKGLIRKKFLFLSLAWFLIHFFVLLDGFSEPGFSVYYKLGIFSSFFFFYLGLREEPMEIQIIPPKRKVKVKEGLFRLIERPDYISEEEISFHKEKKICLVCKGTLSRVMYTCPTCDAMYCIICFEALSNLENACWVCETPFDESKPVKLAGKEKERIEIEDIDKKKEK